MLRHLKLKCLSKCLNVICTRPNLQNCRGILSWAINMIASTLISIPPLLALTFCKSQILAKYSFVHFFQKWFKVLFKCLYRQGINSASGKKYYCLNSLILAVDQIINCSELMLFLHLRHKFHTKVDFKLSNINICHSINNNLCKPITFFAQRFTEAMSLSHIPPHNWVASILNFHIIFRSLINDCISFAVNIVRLSDTSKEGQPLLGIKREKLYTNVHVYKETSTAMNGWSSLNRYFDKSDSAR